MSDALIRPLDAGVARLEWSGDQPVLEEVRALVEAELATGRTRVEALVGVEDEPGQRLAVLSGLRREGVRRSPDGDRVVYARLAGDAPISEPLGFRQLLNAALPRKRAIGQMLIRNPAGHVMLCQLTYKNDWDLPGGVVEVAESPRLATEREVQEELGLTVAAQRLLLTDWLPAWSGWDDALCLIFDGGVQPDSVLGSAVLQAREIKAVAFCTPAEVNDRCADFTTRRITAALASPGSAYTESGCNQR